MSYLAIYRLFNVKQQDIKSRCSQWWVWGWGGPRQD